MGNIFLDLTVVICLASVLSLIFRVFKQPEILAYILTGIIIASFHFFNASNQSFLQALSELGITLLLFMVGLEIRISELFSIGRPLVIASLGQIIFTFLGGFLISGIFGFDFLNSFYISTALTFSSTIIVVKLLSDQRELHSLHAKFSLGILLAQDIVAIVLLMFLSGFGTQFFNTGAILTFFTIILKGAFLVGIIWGLSRYVFPKILEPIAKSSETLFLVSLAWVFGLAAIVSSKYIGFSIEIGGFLAGVALANSIVNYQIIAKAKTLRDFFIVIFFVLLGAQMAFADLPKIILPAIIFSLFVLIGKPIIVMIFMSILGFIKRTSFLTGVSLSQISEFSLILVFLGYKFKQINQDSVSLITLTGLITFAVSTYLIAHWKSLYRSFSGKIDFMERKNIKKYDVIDTDGFDNLDNHVVLVGGDQMGQSIVEALEDRSMEVVVVDFDPAIVKSMENKKVHRLFGDISDLDIQERAKIDSAKLVISTIPDLEDNLLLLKELKHENRKAKVVVMALDSRDARTLYKEGADYVILPHLAGGRQIAEIILDESEDRIEKLKQKDLKYLT
jgi:Kef-type K+ transport system membrane component KefB/molybdopterin converting factor small subunit